VPLSSNVRRHQNAGVPRPGWRSTPVDRGPRVRWHSAHGIEPRRLLGQARSPRVLRHSVPQRSSSHGWEHHGTVGFRFVGQLSCQSCRTAQSRSNHSHGRGLAVKHGQSKCRFFTLCALHQVQHYARALLTAVALVSFGTRRKVLPHQRRCVGGLVQQRPQASILRVAKSAFATQRTVPPNPSLKRTHNGVRRMAFISFWAIRRMPLRAA
jgi:hypothetical protein